MNAISESSTVITIIFFFPGLYWVIRMLDAAAYSSNCDVQEGCFY